MRGVEVILYISSCTQQLYGQLSRSKSLLRSVVPLAYKEEHAPG